MPVKPKTTRILSTDVTALKLIPVVCDRKQTRESNLNKTFLIPIVLTAKPNSNKQLEYSIISQSSLSRLNKATLIEMLKELSKRKVKAQEESMVCLDEIDLSLDWRLDKEQLERRIQGIKEEKSNNFADEMINRNLEPVVYQSEANFETFDLLDSLLGQQTIKQTDNNSFPISNGGMEFFEDANMFAPSFEDFIFQ